MKKGFHLGQSEFDALLNLLSPDRDEAGVVYERVRLGLFRYFRYKGCADPADLVDETFNRVAVRTEKFDSASNLTPERYFYGFAGLIAKEHKRKTARLSPLDGSEANGHAAITSSSDGERELICLEGCLGTLDADDRELITEYHSLEGQARIDLRHRICGRLSLTPTALYVKMSRIRKRLKRCIEDCKKNRM
jgi:DNA-directed RNA polymerase specialized sigma24 family protein